MFYTQYVEIKIDQTCICVSVDACTERKTYIMLLDKDVKIQWIERELGFPLRR